MQNPLHIINRFRAIIKDLRERNERLADELQQACRGEALYKESLIEERQRNYELSEKIHHLNRRIRALQMRERELQRSFQKRLWQAHNPHVPWQDFKTEND